MLLLGPRVGPFSLLLGFRFPYKPLQTKKGTLLIPGLLLGLDLGSLVVSSCVASSFKLWRSPDSHGGWFFGILFTRHHNVSCSSFLHGSRRHPAMPHRRSLRDLKLKHTLPNLPHITTSHLQRCASGSLLPQK